MPIASLRPVIVPLAVLVIVLFTPAKMPAPFAPTDSAPLLVTTLLSLTLMDAVPLSLTVAPVSTFTVRLVTPPPAAKPSISVPLQVTVWPLTAASGWQSARADVAERANIATTDDTAAPRRSPPRPLNG